jgi:hypothetical protein
MMQLKLQENVDGSTLDTSNLIKGKQKQLQFHFTHKRMRRIQAE